MAKNGRQQTWRINIALRMAKAKTVKMFLNN